ncbi:MAG TPA: phytochelatin synthase family protein [Polyangiaceae bacterium]|nr:phytochelatin synthase family protein [Polyangiaceae bacterium]
MTENVKSESGRRWLRAILLVLSLPLVLALLLFARLVLFPTHYDVPTIANTAEYQNRELLARAWALPAASSFKEHVDYQSNGSVCGPASLANIFRSLHEPAAETKAVLEGTGLCRTGICFGGLTLDEVAEVARKRTHRSVTLLRDLSLQQFREHLERSNDPSRRYLINFNRGLLFGQGHGHHSPIGGFLADRDLVFVLDVNSDFKPWLVSSERLFRAMDSVDSSSGKKRGLLLIE